jgi:hypothetical protein
MRLPEESVSGRWAGVQVVLRCLRGTYGKPGQLPERLQAELFDMTNAPRPHRVSFRVRLGSPRTRAAEHSYPWGCSVRVLAVGEENSGRVCIRRACLGEKYESVIRKRASRIAVAFELGLSGDRDRLLHAGNRGGGVSHAAPEPRTRWPRWSERCWKRLPRAAARRT